MPETPMSEDDPWLMSAAPLVPSSASGRASASGSMDSDLEVSGWRRLKGEPILSLLPAVWPRPHVGWIPQPLSPTITPKHVVVGDDGLIDSRRTRPGTPQPRTLEDDEDLYEVLYGDCAAAQLPRPPMDVLQRAYVLRHPGQGAVDDLLKALIDAAGGTPATPVSVVRACQLLLADEGSL